MTIRCRAPWNGRSPLSARTCALATALWAGSCASYQPLDVSTEDIESAVVDREPSHALVREAVDLADLEALALELPDEDAALDPANVDYWRACAYAWNPAVRAARREVLAAREARRSAGSPDPVGVQVVDHDFGDDDPLVEAVAVFDLVGLLGVGPSAAAKELASVEELAAIGRLEAALWAARFDVERARIRLAAARVRSSELASLHDESALDLERVFVLERRGWLSKIQAQVADGRVHAVEHQKSRNEDAVADAHADLSRAAGLVPGHPALDVPGAATLVEARGLSPVALPDELPLIETHPALRSARLAFATAEARVRSAAALSWPGIELGPHLSFPSSGMDVGGVMRLRLPFPSQWRGALAAAEEERGAALEALEDAYLALLADGDAADHHMREARYRQIEHGRPLYEASLGNWRSAHARFLVSEVTIENWGRALRDRQRALLMLVDDDESGAIATLDLTEALGPAARPVSWSQLDARSASEEESAP